MLIVNAIVNKLTEVCAPYLLKKYRKNKIQKQDGDEIETQAHSFDQYEV
jgi:hypothetical protein